MSLIDYIDDNIERLVAEWTEFARTRLPAAQFIPVEALTNGSKTLLNAIVADMRTAQTEAGRQAKSRGELDESATRIGTISREHADQRLNDGFTLDQLVSEYRALRASVTRCWLADASPVRQEDLEELRRFNEAMDQALTEAIHWFYKGLEQSRDIFVGMLSHDLRGPLNAAVNANDLQRLVVDDAGKFASANELVAKSLERMTRLVNDLLDFARTRLGRPLQLSRQPTDMREICTDIVEAMQVVAGEQEIRLETSGSLEGYWDPDRMHQVLSNILGNALRHGDSDKPVTVSARADGGDVVLRVHNHGEPIALERQHVLFDPLHGVSAAEDTGSRGGLGLGLYIVRSIVEAHGGTIDLTSDTDEGTAVTVVVPRDAAA